MVSAAMHTMVSEDLTPDRLNRLIEHIDEMFMDMDDTEE
jgi:hypothetical protein